MYKRCGNLKILKAKHTEYRLLPGKQEEACSNVKLLLLPLVVLEGSTSHALEDNPKGRLEI